jgi:uncharacterized coiled-coil protein SlyX
MSEATPTRQFSAGALFAIIGGIATTFGLIATVVSLIISVNSQWTQFQTDLKALTDKMKALDAAVELRIASEFREAASHRNSNTLRITVLEEQLKSLQKDEALNDKLASMQKMLDVLVDRSPPTIDTGPMRSYVPRSPSMRH